MSSHYGDSSVLLEHTASPPHLLSPDRASSDMPAVDNPDASDQQATEQVTSTRSPEEPPHALADGPQEPTSASTTVEESSTTQPVVSAEDTEAHTAPEEASTVVPVDTSATDGTSLEPVGSVTVDATLHDDAVTSPEEHMPERSSTPPALPVVLSETGLPAATEPESLPENDLEPESEPEDTAPSWVRYEEDTSIPDEEELKEIETSEHDKLSATDIAGMEEQFYSDLEDPEQRPSKKLRLNWVIKGVRGTREKPNMAKVMNSPAVCVDGLYWSIKFYPRGDNCSSLSAFVRCSRSPPKQVEEMPEHTFAFFEGAPDADFSKNYEPKVKVSAPNTQRVREEFKPKRKDSVASREGKKAEGENEGLDDLTRDTTAREPESSDRREDEDDDLNDSTDDIDDKDLEDWRVPAQLGMVIYNPAEPRTGNLQSDGHQFSKHCDDWGWVNFVGPWDEIHKRKRGQRQPLLRDDTLGIDAYIRIYDDITQALWWHDSKTENQWPSKQLSGYYPMGTPALYHSPAVAGITAWTILAPFRDAIQRADGGKWRRDSSFNPKPLLCQSQIVLHQMRNLTNDCYVNVFKIVEELVEADEPWEDVKSFWEVYRRGLELELADNEEALKKLSDIFDAGGKAFKMPSLPVPGEPDIATGMAKHFDDLKFKGALPNFLPVMLNRQQFNKAKREWTLHHNRVELNDHLDLSSWSTDENATYTLYGFIAHIGSRNSGKFYAVLRPGGPGTRWLAFEDGNGNKVYSYTHKRVQEYEGLEGEELKNVSSIRENAYLAMYVRDRCFKDYLLPDGLEPYKLPKWLRNHSEGPYDELTEAERAEEQKQEAEDEKRHDEEGMKVELYLDEFVKGHENLLNLHELRMSTRAKEHCHTVMVASDKTYRDLRQKITTAFGLSDSSQIALWELSYRSLGKYLRAELETVSDRRRIERDVKAGEVWRMWLTVLQPGDEQKSYRSLLPRISEMGLNIKTPVQEPPSETGVDEATRHGDDSTSNPDEATPIAENPLTERSRLTIDTSSSQTEDSNTTGIATPATGDTGDSAADMEQASVAAAVALDVDAAVRARSDDVSSSEEAAGVMESANGSDPQLPDPSTETVAVAEADEIATQVVLAPPGIVSSEEDQSADAADSSDGAESAVRDAGEALPTATPHSTDELSAEDAAAIAAVLAADEAEVAEQHQEHSHTDSDGVQDNQQDQPPRAEAGEIVQADSAFRNPLTQPLLHLYGFLHSFDAEGQKFIAEKPFSPELEMKIGPAIRKALEYEEDKDIRIWKREGPSGTTPISSSSTFANANFQDGFMLIVGDVLTDAKVDELKQAGKFWQPAPLIKYLTTSRRGHPILSKTTTEPVEIAEYGGDYFKGPIVNGQPHGKDCLLITSSGHTYEGPLVAGLKSGAGGRMTYQNGDVYNGEWLNDERHGQGEHVEARTGNRYVGGFENGKRWGEGVTYWKVADDQAAMCQICYGEEIDALFYDCGHVCACVECAKQCENCPICRKSVRHVVKMFRA